MGGRGRGVKCLDAPVILRRPAVLNPASQDALQVTINYLAALAPIR
jgi:hypothetical protein